ncbi:3-oxoacyl-[acyl-carrier-protein] reductase FabG [Aspergillus awamori]|uniref:3-oxoacyl-[acyl-carrier-protein] reductase FabG n=1 Tax=Aspergillus awamori TaxID=105351 RepID=A0A401KCW9_ASPAW|nr:3-oxoacyl-[acyl-carrier-protein] reductase FabG [Aspergillus awamori]
MDFSDLPTDYFAKAEQFTRGLYYDVYPSGIASSFAKAGASVLILPGRTKQDLEAAAAELQVVAPRVETDVRVVDISNEIQVKDIFVELREAYPRIDILVNNAGAGGSPLPIVEIDAERWWHNFEVNVKGTFLMTQHFLQLNGKDREVTIINVASAAALNSLPCLSSYSLSKLCQIRLQDFRTPWNRQDPHDPSCLRTFFKNTFELVGGVTVWLASEQATFMNGRYMSVNWSVDELVERKDETVSNGLLSIRLQGKFGHF